MAKLGIIEFDKMPQDVDGREVAVGRFPSIASGALNITSGVTSRQLNAATRFVRLHSDAICQLDISVSGAPSQGGPFRMAADQTEYFGVQNGTGTPLTIRVISDT